MKIVIISTHDIYGGAALATYRLHKALIGQGAKSTMLVKEKYGDDPTVIAVGEDKSCQPGMTTNESLEDYCIKNNRPKLANSLQSTFFSFNADGYDLSKNCFVVEADIINLHWCDGFLSATSISELLRLGKPVVWTFHDQYPFTGGCHYTNGCEKYVLDCQDCPQLRDDAFYFPALFLDQKKQCFGLELNNLSAISPSKWLRDCAVKSPLFKNKTVEVIPNSIDCHDFKPMPQKEARKRLNLPEDAFILLFVASDMNESRKGLDILNKSLNAGIEGPLQELIEQDKILLLMVGHSALNHTNTPPIPHLKLEFLDGPEMLCQAYNSADIMVFSSREDNLPNTIIEAMSCGLPTVAYDVGGVKDIIDHNVTGYLIPQGDHLAFAETIAKVANKSDETEILKKNCIESVSKRYASKVQVGAYLTFFERSILQNTGYKEISSDMLTVSANIRAEIIKRITAGSKGSGQTVDKTAMVDKWLNKAALKDSIHYLTPPRKFQHEEEGYDEQYGIAQNDFTYGNGLGNLLQSRKCNFSAPALEIGCGTGLLTMGMCQKNHFPLFIASDASPAFLRIVKNKLEQTKNLGDSIRLAVLDGDALTSAPKRSFSLIVLKATLHHIIDPQQFIHNISDLLVPNGMLVFHEPFWEGSVLLGMMAQTLMDKKYNSVTRKFWKGLMKVHRLIPNRYTEAISKWASQESYFGRLQLLIDTMKASARRDIDKSDWEDKHLFKVSDIMKWGHEAKLDVEFIANREFNEFADNCVPETFSYRNFIFTYLSKCMNYGDQFAKEFEAELGTSFDYLDQIAANNNSPEYHGIFLYRKR